MGDALQRCERTTISVATADGPKDIRAWKLNGFACHQGLASLREFWTVTHLGTGRSLQTCGVFETEDEAADAMERIAAEGDWASWEAMSNDDKRALGLLTKRVFADHGAVEA